MARRGLVQDDVVDVVDGLPDLLDLIPSERLGAARRALRARSMIVRKGRWDAEHDAALTAGGIGFLVLDGALVRCVSAAHRTSGELLGPGDLLRPSQDSLPEPPFGVFWRAVPETRLAPMDARFARSAAAVPELTGALAA